MAEVRTRPEKDGGDSRNVHDVMHDGELVDTYDTHSDAVEHVNRINESVAAQEAEHDAIETQNSEVAATHEL